MTRAEEIERVKRLQDDHLDTYIHELRRRLADAFEEKKRRQDAINPMSRRVG